MEAPMLSNTARILLMLLSLLFTAACTDAGAAGERDLH